MTRKRFVMLSIISGYCLEFVVLLVLSMMHTARKEPKLDFGDIFATSMVWSIFGVMMTLAVIHLVPDVLKNPRAALRSLRSQLPSFRQFLIGLGWFTAYLVVGGVISLFLYEASGMNGQGLISSVESAIAVGYGVLAAAILAIYIAYIWMANH